MAHPRKAEPEKSCKRCGVKMQRSRSNGRLEGFGDFTRRKYCSLSCANTRERPAHWETFHWRARKHRGLFCEACGSTERLHAHHVDGKPENNFKENIQTLCVFCHNFLHATADRLGWTEPGRLPPLREATGLEPSETP
jgi:tRNA(Ile)-lysidine synthase TilS/MesJ